MQQEEAPVFYLNYLNYEQLPPQNGDPHERLNCFYLAIMEAIFAGQYSVAYEIYQDLLAKKAFFPSSDSYPFREEMGDLQLEIVEALLGCGLKASMNDFTFY